MGMMTAAKGFVNVELAPKKDVNPPRQKACRIIYQAVTVICS